MTTHIALLRGINVGGRKPVAMEELRAIFAGLGVEDVRTLLQSGNVVFRGPAQSAAELERLLETEAEKQLGLRTTFMVRTADEWHDLISRNPFPDAAKRDPGHLVALLLKEPAPAKAVEALVAASKGPERIHGAGSHLYVVYPDGIGRSKLTNQLIEGKLGTRATGRNWNTVLKLAGLAPA